MAVKQFKAESKRLMDLMINSIYTHREIFLRELISNASDAIDKIYYKTLTDETMTFNKDDYFIKLSVDEANRVIKLSDTGIGMTEAELEENLGTIAKSGSLQFKKDNELDDEHDIIGQFGVGFYSAFLVADKVTVVTKALGSDSAYKWESTGADGYTIEQTTKETIGTDIYLHVKENHEDENYDEYLSDYKLQEIVKKYSDFIRYPIKMDVTSYEPQADNEEESVEIKEEKTINSMVPIWKKNKRELTTEDYENFYQEKHFGFDKPLDHIHLSVDGNVSYNAILYIPENTPYDFYTPDYEKGLELYSSGVMIMNKCADLLPDYFSFVKGIVDSDDLSLNISRELLQHDRQLKLIAKNIKTKVKNELEKMVKNDREKYETFYASFGRTLKFGVYQDFGANKDVLQDLIMFTSSSEDKLVTLSDYVSRMKEDQKEIYYAVGESIDRIKKLPQAEAVTDLGYEVLYLTEDIDEFAIKMLMNYDGKEFKSVQAADLDIAKDEKAEEKTQENASLFDNMKSLLNGKVATVRASTRLKSHPVCLTNEGDISIEMEKVLNAMPNGGDVKADKVLEVNVNHDIFASLQDAYDNDRARFDLYTDVLYNQALLIEGLSIEDPVAFADNVCKLMK